MSEWKEYKVGDLCHGIYDGPHATPEKTNHGPIFLGISNLSSGRIDLSDVDHLSEESFRKWTRRITPQANDVVFSYETRLGEAALIPDGLRCCLGRRMALMRPNLEKVDPQFLLYVYLSPAFQETITARTIYGSTVNRIALIEFPSYPIKVPSLKIQKSISSILSNIDRKIDNLRRQNETLEEIARSIFKHWFIDFEFPNPDGKPYKSSGGAMVRSELGDIPEGWRVGKLGDIAKNIKNGIRESEIKPEMLHIGLEHIPRRCIALDSWEKAVGVASNKFKFVEGNILFGKLRPYFHKVGIAPVGGICSTDILVVDSKDKAYFEIVLMLLSSDDFIRYVTLASEGTRMPRTSWEYMKDYPITVSNSPLTKKFNELLHPSIEKLKINIFQIQTLTKTHR
jgi:type I restriction enzyme, S subunit